MLGHKVTVVVAATIAATALTIAAGVATAAPRQRPIVYAVVLDGLDGDRIEQGQAPFISSMLAGEEANGTYYPQSRSVIPAETNPNHTAMMSGAFPGKSGIPANAFALYAPTAGEDTCVTTSPLDFSVMPTETSGESATCPTAEMTFEAIKRQGNPDELATAGIFGKPKLGRIFAGQNFQSGSYDADYLWAPCSSGAEDDPYCGSVPTNPITGYAVDDKAVMDQVLASMNGIEGDFDTRRPDFTFVNLHQIDSAGHASGPGGLNDSAIGLADMEIERLVSALRERGEWERTVLILVSDHSMDSTPDKIVLTETLIDAGIAESEFLAVDNGSIDLIYLANRNSPARFELLKQMRSAILAEPGVTEALYRGPNPADGGETNTVDAVHPEWRAAGERSGDLFVVAGPGYAFSETSASSNPLPGNHGAPQTADNFLAVAGGSELVRQSVVSGHAPIASPTNADLAPTVMGLLGLFAPDDSDGSFLAGAFDRGVLKRVSRPHRPKISVGARRLKVLPEGGRYDIQARSNRGSWRRLRRYSARNSVRLTTLGRGCTPVRARVRSAAAIRSPWRTKKIRCG